MFLGGYPENVIEFYRIKKKYKCLIIEDACHSLGASYKFNKKQVRVGACLHADISCFSLHPVKTITAGEGGIITTNITKRCEELFSYDTTQEASVLIAIRMSSNIPVLFQNFKYLNCFYLDGAISNNFPINIIDENDKKILAIYCKTNNEKDPSELNLVSYIYSLLFVPIKYNVSNNIKLFC